MKGVNRDFDLLMMKENATLLRNERDPMQTWDETDEERKRKKYQLPSKLISINDFNDDMPSFDVDDDEYTDEDILSNKFGYIDRNYYRLKDPKNQEIFLRRMDLVETAYETFWKGEKKMRKWNIKELYDY